MPEYLLTGLTIEICGILAFARLSSIADSVILKYVIVFFVFCSAIVLVYKTLLGAHPKKVLAAFLMFSLLTAFVQQIIARLFYPGILKDVELFSLDNLRIVLFVSIFVLLLQVVFYLCAYIFGRLIKQCSIGCFKL